ncbi:hypothetical protein KUTeg_010329 [Tegillarca granosa]|uniref:F-box domain-containing protein n=1 Tax=Tegillarca granosa TaxID=220873 RepID=A0ABQ9F9Q1_TEGGR|nr:hypothetical protein KUTeg_010329 [Tegillarca granosa]
MATQSDDLEEFRKSWKKELENQHFENDRNWQQAERDSGTSSQPTSRSELPTKITKNSTGLNKESDLLTVQTKHPAFRESNSYTCTVASGSCVNKATQQYYPFRIVGNLLDESSPCYKNENKKRSLDPNFSSLDHKKVKKSTKFEKSNDLKKKRLKDIFTFKERVNKEVGECFLDQFIADLYKNFIKETVGTQEKQDKGLNCKVSRDEINEIPFFEIKLAREIAIKIFQYLDIRDLCSCSQVSRSWRSLAEDELLWCSICHRKGYEESFHTVDRANWKMIVRNHVETKRRLDLNWRNRIGKVTQLEHIQGGYLCAVTSDGETVVAGYTNGQVKMWDIEDQDQCIFNPSNTALIIDEGEESGTISNFITHIALSSTLVAAAYKHGNVDIWRRLEGTDPIQTIRVGLNNNNNRNNHVYKDNKDILLATHLEIHSAKIYGDGISFDPMVTIATENAVKLYKSDHPSSQMIDIHSHLVNWGYIKIYDVSSNKLKSTLLGSTWIVTCMNTHDSPTNMVVTGSGDRKIRVYDIRMNHPVVTYAGLHSLTSVQMDEWKVVSSGDDGFVCVWDQRMATKLWDWHNSSPVKHCRFSERRLIVGNVPTVKSQVLDEFETHIPKRLRGTISVYDFTVDQLTEGVPEECLSTYDQPEAYNYNIRLAMPYDNI